MIDHSRICGICGHQSTKPWPEQLSGHSLLGTGLCDGCEAGLESGLTKARDVIHYSDKYWAGAVSREDRNGAS